MISEDTYVAEDGSVYGTLKTINDFTDFSSNSDEQNGYYFPLTLTQSGTTMSLIKNGVPSKEDIAFDPEILLKIADQNAVWTIEVDDAEVVKLNFKNATFA